MINLPLHYSIHRDSNLTVRNLPSQFCLFNLTAHISYPEANVEFQLWKNINAVSKTREWLRLFFVISVLLVANII